MFGSEFAVRARIETLNGFSAHAAQSELTDWVDSFETGPRVMLVHGEADTLRTFASHLDKTLGLQATIPALGDRIHF